MDIGSISMDDYITGGQVLGKRRVAAAGPGRAWVTARTSPARINTHPAAMAPVRCSDKTKTPSSAAVSGSSSEMVTAVGSPRVETPWAQNAEVRARRGTPAIPGASSTAGWADQGRRGPENPGARHTAPGHEKAASGP